MKKPAALIGDDSSHLPIYRWMRSSGFEPFSALVNFDPLNLLVVDVNRMFLGNVNWTW